MNDNEVQGDDAQAQAAQWFAILASAPVSRQTIEDYMAWRRIPANREAFDGVERVHGRAGQIADSPAILAATQAAYDRGRRRPRRVNWGASAAAAAAAILIVAASLFTSWPRPAQSYATRIGEQREVALEDGSRVMLDTDTKLSVLYTRDARHVALSQGQAYFTVAHNADRPFIVDAGGTTVVATGTQFDVRRTDGKTDVTLVQGGVDVRSNGASVTHLTSGQRLSLAADSKPIVHSIDTANATAWTQKRIIFDNVTLEEAVAEVNRYTAKPVQLDAPHFASARYSASLNAGDIRAFVTAVTAALPLKATRDAHGSIHLTE